MRYVFYFLGLFLMAGPLAAQHKNITLEECFRIAGQNNRQIRLMKQSLQTRQYRLQATKLSRLPDIDILGGYTYQSDPVKINLQSVREGIVEGTARQNAEAANKVFNEITGSDLSQTAQDAIYSGAKNIINGIYPNYNPELSRQQYFTAGVGLRMPIFLGGKINAARQVAEERVHSGNLNLTFVQNTVAFSLISQYLKALYYNSLWIKQKQLVEAYEKTEKNAANLVKSEMIPPYQQHWAGVALSQAKTGLTTFELEKENALLALQHLLGVDSALTVSDTLTLSESPLERPDNADSFWEQNPGYQWMKSKTDVARASEKVARSMSLPNLFGIANYQFLRKELPLITPPWMVGIAFQWNIFSSLENGKNIKVSQSLVKENQILADEKKEDLRVAIKIAENKIKVIGTQLNTLDEARGEAARTTEMVRRRMQNQLSSVKDVNDAMKVQLEAEKAYYTAMFTYNLAVAAYLNLLGAPESIVNYLK